jgi:hypothetical protein
MEPVALNPAGWLAVAYALLWVVTLLHFNEAYWRKDWRYGTLLLLTSYAIISYYYSKRFLSKPSQYWKERAISFGKASQIGFGGISLFLTLNIFGLLGIASKWYDLFGAIGYGLFAFAKTIGIYFVLVYLISAIVLHWRSSLRTSVDFIQMIARGMLVLFYLSVSL